MSSISFKCLAIENSFKDEDEHANSKAESHNDQFVKKRYFLTGLLAIGFLNFVSFFGKIDLIFTVNLNFVY